MKEIKSKIEAILFCVPDGINIKKLAKLCGIGAVGYVKEILKNMKKEFDENQHGITIVEKDGIWKFAVKDEHIPLVKEAAKPEIEKAVLETLAFIAYKKNIKQSEVVKFRSNKAYDHIKYLEEQGFIESRKKSNTKILLPTKKFYEYFNLKEDEDLKL